MGGDIMHSIVPIVAIVFGCLMPVAMLGVIFLFIFRSNMERQKTLRMAIEKSDSLPPEFMDNLKSLQKKPRTPATDIRAGIILIAVALGFVVWNYLDNGYSIDGGAGFAAIPGFIGIALLILGIIGNSKA